jgi:hypothetical protein
VCSPRVEIDGMCRISRRGGRLWCSGGGWRCSLVHGRRSDGGSRGDDEVRAHKHGRPTFIGARTPRSPGRARLGGAAAGVAALGFWPMGLMRALRLGRAGMGRSGSGLRARPGRIGFCYFPNLFLMRKQFQKNIEIV